MALASSRHPVIPPSRPLLALAWLFLSGLAAEAHPVPKDFYDRTIVVHLEPEAVVVDYRLEIDDLTLWKDLRSLDARQINQIGGAGAAYRAFTEQYGPILAGNLIGRIDGKELTFTCVQHGHQVLDHVRCDFVFRAPWKLAPVEPRRFTIQEENFQREKGRIDLSLGTSPAMFFHQAVAPDAALKERKPLDYQPGDEQRLRRLSAFFELHPPEPAPEPRLVGSTIESAVPPLGPRRLRDLLLKSEHGLVVILLLAGLFGGAHALTPGHGKTLVAAYLVGEHGTVWHALLLGVVTTLTHTGAVLALAGLLLLVPSDTLTRDAQVLLGFVSGLLVLGLGLWLLLRRLAGQADHFHVGGGHHHHHEHQEHAAQAPSAWGLVILGVSGGIVPCWDAIALFVRGVFLNQPGLTLAVLVAFSAGLAGVLVLIGVLVVTVKGFASSHFGESKLVRALPLVSAALIALMGLWLCHDSLHPEGEPPAAQGIP